MGNPLCRGDGVFTVAITLAALDDSDLADLNKSAMLLYIAGSGTRARVAVLARQVERPERRGHSGTCARRKTQIGRLRWRTHYYSPLLAANLEARWAQLNLSASQGD
jgi:hypothetical protein